MSTIPELNKLREILEQNYANGRFVYEDWMQLADQYPEYSRAAKELRKRAAVIERERRLSDG